jgi:NAD(P)-dependent dehydrogenase (short-subunit alcohol dehydrogenase family)
VAARVGIPALLRRPEPRSGRFIADASAAATRRLPLLAAYCASKAGVTGLIRALAAELRGTGVTANAATPGSTATAILDESARRYSLESAPATMVPARRTDFSLFAIIAHGLGRALRLVRGAAFPHLQAPGSASASSIFTRVGADTVA